MKPLDWPRPPVHPMHAPLPPLISLSGAGVRFGDVQALQDVDLQLHQGDRLALVGANGSGKTSLLRLLNGLLPHQGQRLLHAMPMHPGEARSQHSDEARSQRSGEARSRHSGEARSRHSGEARSDHPGEARSQHPGEGRAQHSGEAQRRRPVSAMVFQRPFMLHLSVRRNLQVALWLAGVPAAEREERLRSALDRVGLDTLARRPARALSGGQQQRLALARAWAVRPDILFLDEPTASLDPSAKREVEALIEAFGRDGMTLVLSSHNLGQVKRLATRVIYLEAGRLVVDLPVDDFFRRDALPPAAAQFLAGELPWH